MLKKMIFVFALLSILSSAGFAQAIINLSWQANSEIDLAGYKVYYGEQHAEDFEVFDGYTHVIDVRNNLIAHIPGLIEKQYYRFAVTAYDTANNESDYSNYIIASFESVEIDTIPPIAPVSVEISGTIDINVYIHKQEE